MSKKLVNILLVITLLLIISSCYGGHKITYDKDSGYMFKCPNRAKAGEMVTFETIVVSDGDVFVNVLGVDDVTMVKEGIYQFIMPDHDVEIRIVVKANGLA